MQDLRAAICDRAHGLLNGADGLLLVTEPTRAGAVATMRVINSDGSEASMCGNGLRTVVRYLLEHDGLTGDFAVDTMHATLAVGREEDFAKGVPSFRVEISPVSFEPRDLPIHLEGRLLDEVLPQVSPTLKFSAVAVPNPHLITFADGEMLKGDELVRIGEFLNGENSLTPDGVNVTFCEILDDGVLNTRTFERGVGLTNACGTAMSATSLMYVLTQGGAMDETLTVFNRGGLVKTRVHQRDNDDYFMELIGNATVNATVSGEYEDFVQGAFAKIQIDETAEQSAYEAFLRRNKN
jgi:diaminopimelate epimerase